MQFGFPFLLTELSAGLTTFKMKYRVATGSGTFKEAHCRRRTDLMTSPNTCYASKMSRVSVHISFLTSGRVFIRYYPGRSGSAAGRPS